MVAPQFPTQQFDDAKAALDYVTQLYDAQIAYLRDSLRRFVAGEQLQEHVRARYPFVRVHTDTVRMADSRLSYGFVAGPGTYETTLTRPDLFADYYLQQFQLLLSNHGVSIEVGLGPDPIPVHFSLDEHQHLEGSMPADRRLLLRDQFDLPDLAAMDDGIANGTLRDQARGQANPWRCSRRPGWITRCIACAITPARRPSTSRTSCCSRTTSSTSTSSCAMGHEP
jgi:AMP nucleosidase